MQIFKSTIIIDALMVIVLSFIYKSHGFESVARTRETIAVHEIGQCTDRLRSTKCRRLEGCRTFVSLQSTFQNSIFSLYFFSLYLKYSCRVACVAVLDGSNTTTSWQ